MKDQLRNLVEEQQNLILKTKIINGIIQQIADFHLDEKVIAIGPKENLEAIKPWIAEMGLEYIVKNDPTCMEVYFK